MRLRPLEPNDIDFLYRIENIPEVWRVTWGDAPVSRHLLWEYINSYTADIYADRQLRLIIDIDGEAVGTVDISDFDPRNSRAMLGIVIDPPHRGKGIAKEALSRVIERCRTTFGLHQLAVLVPRDSEPSIALFESLGFRTSGCLRSWLKRGKEYFDVVIMQLML